MTEKRFKSENIDFSNFIVDLNSATSKGANTTKYKSYDTNTKKKCDELTDLLNTLNNENERLKKELFESEKDYIMETYSDNPIRRDEKIQSLKEEFKARFGDD